MPVLRELLAEQVAERARLAPDSRVLDALASAIRSSEMYWVTRDMTRLAGYGRSPLRQIMRPIKRIRWWHATP